MNAERVTDQQQRTPIKVLDAEEGTLPFWPGTLRVYSLFNAGCIAVGRRVGLKYSL